ncbi:hypothetical protein DL771_002149 [Monosporascus sp. 5C6A]|nr:hypothetical protein DL771_002149 [Monosporascus sp. 5C6A]
MASDTQPHPGQRGVEPYPKGPRNVAGEVDYVPHPEKSIPIPPSRKAIQQSIINLYCGSASEKAMAGYIVYPDELVWKQRQQYTFSGLHVSKTADSVISLKLEGQESNEKVVYHKDMWDEKDHSREGLGMLMKKLNGDKLAFITKPPESV